MTDQPALSKTQKQSFISNGYVIIPGAIPRHLVNAATRQVDEAFASGKHQPRGVNRPGSAHPIPVFDGSVKQCPDILNLVFKSGLIQLVEELLGKGNAIVRGNLGQIAVTEANEIFVAQGRDPKQPHPSHRWHIDSGTGTLAAYGSEFSCLIGVALSAGQHLDESRGQFTVWPGKH